MRLPLAKLVVCSQRKFSLLQFRLWNWCDPGFFVDFRHFRSIDGLSEYNAHYIMLGQSAAFFKKMEIGSSLRKYHTFHQDQRDPCFSAWIKMRTRFSYGPNNIWPAVLSSWLWSAFINLHGGDSMTQNLLLLSIAKIIENHTIQRRSSPFVSFSIPNEESDLLRVAFEKLDTFDRFFRCRR